MNMPPRLSLLSTVALCALPFVFSTAKAPAAQSKVIGTLFVQGTVLLNDKTARTGADVPNGAKIQTGSQPAKVTLFRGGSVLIKPNSRVRIFEFDDKPVQVDIIFGEADVRKAGGGGGQPEDPEGVEQLSYNAAAGFGNFSFPSIGGGGSANGPVTSGVTASGRIGFFDSVGTFVGFK